MILAPWLLKEIGLRPYVMHDVRSYMTIAWAIHLGVIGIEGLAFASG
jgi:hypothetical protein